MVPKPHESAAVGAVGRGGESLPRCNHPQRMRSVVANSHAGHVANGDVRQVANIKRFNGFYGA